MLHLTHIQVYDAHSDRQRSNTLSAYKLQPSFLRTNANILQFYITQFGFSRVINRHIQNALASIFRETLKWKRNY